MPDNRSAAEIVADIARQAEQQGQMGIKSRASIQQGVEESNGGERLEDNGVGPGMADGKPLIDPRISNKHQSPV